MTLEFCSWNLRLNDKPDMLDNNPSIQEMETKPGPLSEFPDSPSYIAIPSLKIKEYKIKIK